MAKKSRFTNEPLTKDELEFLAKPPRMSIRRLGSGNGNATDWYNLYHRILATEVMAGIGYCKETASQIAEGRKLLEVIFERELPKGEEENWLVRPDDEYLLLEACLDAADEAQKEIDRHTQIFSYRKSFHKAGTYTRRFDKYIASLEGAKECKPLQSKLPPRNTRASSSASTVA